jgi:hypothetical protein
MDERTEEAIARFILEAWANTTRSDPTPRIMAEIHRRWPGVTGDEIRRAAIVALELSEAISISDASPVPVSLQR